MAITHTFKGGKGLHGWGYYAFIEDGKLVIGENWPHEGGNTFMGTYAEAVAKGHLEELKRKATSLYNDIEKYFNKHGVKDDIDDLKKKYSFDKESCTVLFKVKLHMDNGNVHNVLVRGRSQSGVVGKLMPKIPEVLMLQTLDAIEFAVRSDKIYAVEFTE